MLVDVLLLEPKTCGNVGFIARAMKNFDMGKLTIFNPRYEFSEDIYGFAMKARDVVENADIIIPDSINGTDILDQLGKKYDIVVGTTAKPISRKKVFRIPLEPRELAKKILGKKCLLVFGREDTGLTDAELSRCDLTVTIPTSEAYPAMNLSHAASLIFYEIFIQSSITKEDQENKRLQEDLVPATRASRQDFYNWLDTTLKDKLAGVTEDWRAINFFQAMKNTLERASITKRELTIISGFMKELAQRIKPRSCYTGMEKKAIQ